LQNSFGWPGGLIIYWLLSLSLVGLMLAHRAIFG
jgi:hypothetical protein